MIDLEQFLRGFNAPDQRNIGHLVSLVGQIHGERGLGRSRYPYQNQVSLVQVTGFLAIIMLDRKVDRLHPFVVIRVDTLQQSGLFSRWRTQIARKSVYQRTQQIHGNQGMLFCHPFNYFGKMGIDQRIYDHAGVMNRHRHGLLHIGLRTYLEKPLYPHIFIIKLGESRPDNTFGGFTRRVGENINCFHGKNAIFPSFIKLQCKHSN